MKSIFKPGDKKRYVKVVEETDSAAFESGQVHPVYSTFALARDAEWVCRLFVLEMKESNEEGIGTFINVRHVSPALFGAEVTFTATVRSIEKNEIICDYEAKVGKRVIASGEQGQKILGKEKIDRLLHSLE